MMTVVLIPLFLVFFSSWANLTCGLSLLFLSLVVGGSRCGEWAICGGHSMDQLSWILSALSVWIIFMILLSEGTLSPEKNNTGGSFRVILLSLLSLLMLVFSAASLFNFYIWFEMSILPMFSLILGWGAQPERIKAVMYLFVYTIFGSLPVLLCLSILGQAGVFFFNSGASLCQDSFLMAVSSTLAFLIKLPLYFSHLWLVKAHVEASVAGSMMLASILLKLGGFGLIRMLSILPILSSILKSIYLSWALLGGVYVSFLCLRSEDIKVLIALSSVAHMALVAGGIFTNTSWGINGATIIMVGHGFASSGLFVLANVLYSSLHTRSFTLLRGGLSLAPAASMWWFILIAINMAAPPSINLLGEINTLISLFSFSLVLAPALTVLAFMSVAYSLSLYAKSQPGKTSLSVAPASSLTPSEMLLLLLHSLPPLALISSGPVLAAIA